LCFRDPIFGSPINVLEVPDYLITQQSTAVSVLTVFKADLLASEVSFYWRTVVIICVFAAVTVGAAVLGLVLLHYRNKKLYVAYQSLRNNNIGLEEHTATGSDDVRK
jgi:hypothetical protein